MGCFLLLKQKNHDLFNCGLNPCCDGMFSIKWELRRATVPAVLILVVMGCFLLSRHTAVLPAECLNPCCDGMFSILFEDYWGFCEESLNPCCDGMFSILNDGRVFEPSGCLNPCCDGMFSIH